MQRNVATGSCLRSGRLQCECCAGAFELQSVLRRRRHGRHLQFGEHPRLPIDRDGQDRRYTWHTDAAHTWRTNAAYTWHTSQSSLRLQCGDSDRSEIDWDLTRRDLSGFRCGQRGTARVLRGSSADARTVAACASGRAASGTCGTLAGVGLDLVTADGGASSDDDKNFQAPHCSVATYNTMCNMQHADCKMQRTACSGDKQGELTRVPSLAPGAGGCTRRSAQRTLRWSHRRTHGRPIDRSRTSCCCVESTVPQRCGLG
jgi:hypothetical protein